MAIVRGRNWLLPLANQVRALGYEVELTEKLTPARDDVACTLIAYDALTELEVASLATSLREGAWQHPVLLALEERLDPSIGTLVQAGLGHLVAMNTTGPLLPLSFEHTLKRLAGGRRSSVSGFLDHRRVLQSHRVLRSGHKPGVVAAAGGLATRYGAPRRLADTIRTAADELITNALYNAPVDAQGRHRFSHLNRGVAVELGSSEVVEVTLGVDGKQLALRVTDPFGSLEPERLYASLARGVETAGVEDKPGGAGLGLGWVFRTAAQLLVTIVAGRYTEIITLYDLIATNRAMVARPRSLDVFLETPLTNPVRGAHSLEAT